jgi:hypothetical protein
VYFNMSDNSVCLTRIIEGKRSFDGGEYTPRTIPGLNAYGRGGVGCEDSDAAKPYWRNP